MVISSTPADFPKYLGACLLKAQKDLLKVVATDGKRLSLSQCPCGAGVEVDLLLPIPALKELVRLLMGNAPESQIDVLYDGSTVWFRAPLLDADADELARRAEVNHYLIIFRHIIDESVGFPWRSWFLDSTT